jgi:2-(1,2-epoxy-1,2-dihydrophenyl)acetyl-CoA isomerase
MTMPVTESRDPDVRTLDGALGVAVVELNRPPHNYFDTGLIRALADAYARLSGDGTTRAIVLASAGKNFCAGMDFSQSSGRQADELYAEARRLFEVPIPVVAAVQGSAVGGGLGVALSADFRVASSQSRFSANFTAIGLHPGFGLTWSLPQVVGRQAAADLMLTGRRCGGDEAFAMGLCDRLAPDGEVRAAAIEFAASMAAAAPLAVREVKISLGRTRSEEFARATAAEFAAQTRLFGTEDFAEGVAASRERREPRFRAR